MRIVYKYLLGQLSSIKYCIFLILCVFIMSSCSSNKEEAPLIPPETSPLTGDYIGFGVITASFTHITSDPSENSDSLGYLRRGSLVKIIRRQIIRTSEGFISWVLIDGEQEGSRSGQTESTLAVQQGWLKEDVMVIYNNESQARTASESVLR